MGLGLFSSDIEQQLNYSYNVSKKNSTVYSPTTTYSPQLDYTYSPQIVINSPYASQSESLSKKQEVEPQVKILPYLYDYTPISQTPQVQKKETDASGLILLGLGVAALYFIFKK